MKPASNVSLVVLGIWVLAHLVAFGLAALVFNGVMGMHFDSMHTSNTAFDPIRGLTRETVSQNIWTATWRCVWIAPVAAAVVYFISDVLWEHLGENRQAHRAFLALTCITMLLAGIVYADVCCYLKYPQR